MQSKVLAVPPSMGSLLGVPHPCDTPARDSCELWLFLKGKILLEKVFLQVFSRVFPAPYYNYLINVAIIFSSSDEKN